MGFTHCSAFSTANWIHGKLGICVAIVLRACVSASSSLVNYRPFRRKQVCTCNGIHLHVWSWTMHIMDRPKYIAKIAIWRCNGARSILSVRNIWSSGTLRWSSKWVCWCPKASTPATYLWFKKSPFTKDEALRHIWVLLLLSINSVQSYQKVWTRGRVHRLVWLVICTSVHACM